MQQAARPALSRTPVWDAPTRLFHWAVVAAIPAMWWTAEEGQLERHRLIGYGLLALLIFRLLWGVAGSDTARFSRFLTRPARTLRYARTELFRRDAPPPAPGHNPLGGWSVVLMLALLLAQIGLGLFAVDTDGIESGPLSYLVDFDRGRWAAGWHERLFNALLALIALHVAAILFYAGWKRRDLIRPMLRGWTETVPGPAPRLAPASRALLVAALSAAAVWAGLRAFGQGV